ncbi:MAG: flagellar biosynthetic protein FliO, partial [Bauldia sp.]|nr:flagellar biosynthetic protein FliO [Bauldia sp.]
MRDYFVSLLGETGATVLQVILTFLAVVGLLAVVVWVVRNFAGGRFSTGGGPRAPRLGVIDSVPVDGKRRLVLVRRDQFEHLLLVGGPTDIVVEETIYRGVPLANYPRNEGARPPAAPSVPGGGQGALRGGTGALPQADEPADAPVLSRSPAARPAANEESAPAPEASPPAPPPRETMTAQPERRAADSPMRGVQSSVEPHAEVPFAAIDRQSRAASFATRFQSGFGRGSVARRSVARETQPAEIQPVNEPYAAVGSPPPPTALAAVAAAIAVVPDEPPATPEPQPESSAADSDWITPAFADALEPRQAIPANDPAAAIDEPPVEEMLAPAPQIEEA